MHHQCAAQSQAHHQNAEERRAESQGLFDLGVAGQQGSRKSAVGGEGRRRRPPRAPQEGGGVALRGLHEVQSSAGLRPVQRGRRSNDQPVGRSV